MKKHLFLIVGLLLIGSMTAGAQGLIIKGGLTYTNMAIKDIKLQGHSGWEAGIGFQTDAVMGFSLQPEAVYKVKGVTLEDAATNVKLNYIEVPVNVQWGVDLLVAKPFIFAAPFIGYCLGTRFSKATDVATAINDNLNKFEYGLGLGLGLNVFKFQITGKYSWNFGPITDWQQTATKVQGLDPAAGTLEICVGLRF